VGWRDIFSARALCKQWFAGLSSVRSNSCHGLAPVTVAYRFYMSNFPSNNRESLHVIADGFSIADLTPVHTAHSTLTGANVKSMSSMPPIRSEPAVNQVRNERSHKESRGRYAALSLLHGPYRRYTSVESSAGVHQGSFYKQRFSKLSSRRSFELTFGSSMTEK
jgi:hypothetical protein